MEEEEESDFDEVDSGEEDWGEVSERDKDGKKRQRNGITLLLTYFCDVAFCTPRALVLDTTEGEEEKGWKEEGWFC